MFEQKERILLLGAHPDDVEYGMAGTIHKFQQTFRRAQYHVISATTEYPPNKKIVTELKAASAAMGISDPKVADFPWMEFHQVRGKIRQYLFEVNKTLNPDLVFLPSPRDVHQDHEVLSQEAFRIFRDTSCLSYEIVRSSLDFRPNVFVELSQEDLEAKIRVLGKYTSQRGLYYFDPSVIRSVAITRGAQAKQRLAEAYEVLRLKI
jgi:LmbE family N-acetylglucosaminyl deacetylase